MLPVLVFLLFLVVIAFGLHQFSKTKLGSEVFHWLGWYTHYLLILVGLVFLLLPSLGYHYTAYSA